MNEKKLEAANQELAASQELDDDTQRGKYMTFKCENEYYGIAISYVDEITAIQTITEVPEMEDYIKGLINLRGKIVPVIDVRLRFHKPALEYNDRTCIIVIMVDTDVIGLIVDTIAEVVTIKDSDIVAPPHTETGSSKYIYAIGKIGDDVKLLVDPRKLISDEIPVMEA